MLGGGATFDVAMRFLKEDPWDRLKDIRERVPNVLLQCLVRGSNGVGYTNYPDNAVSYFIERAADEGMDIFRVFDSLNWADSMKNSIESILKSGKLCEAAICYTGDLFDPRRPKYNLDYYVAMARELKATGTHILGIKDMGGLCRPEAVRVLVKTLKEETGLPIHFHTHDTSGIAASSVLAAAEAGADAGDLAMDAFSGLTSQPNLGSVALALRDMGRETGLDPEIIREFSNYWEAVRVQYTAFESDLRAGASEVYLHEMPGGQFTNLKEQARALGLAERWHEVAKTYADVNRMVGDIVKVTPSSKVVGDMALAMVSSGVSVEQVEDPDHDTVFPDSMVAMLRGELGQPPGGWPEALQKKALKGQKPIEGLPSSHVPPVDLDAARKDAESAAQRQITDNELASWLMYPTVFADYVAHRRDYSRVDVLPTPVFFYGMQPDDEIAVDIDPGKTLIIRLMAVGDPDESGKREVFFELNGQPRIIRTDDRNLATTIQAAEKANPDMPGQVPAPMPGVVSTITVSEGQKVDTGDVLMTLEAMKMETAITAPVAGTVRRVVASVSQQVDAKDLVAVIATGD